MQEVCINRLNISGQEDNIKAFLNDFHSKDYGFSMACIVPYNYNMSEAWRHSNWGTINDIFECDSMAEVLGTYTEENLIGTVTMKYCTVIVPNEVFIKKASRIYKNLKFTITYFEPSEIFAGRTVFENGLEVLSQSIFYELDEDELDKSLIDVYEFAIIEDFTSVSKLAKPLSKAPEKVKEHFNNKQEDIVLNFEDLQREYNEEQGEI